MARFMKSATREQPFSNEGSQNNGVGYIVFFMFDA